MYSNRKMYGSTILIVAALGWSLAGCSPIPGDGNTNTNTNTNENGNGNVNNNVNGNGSDPAGFQNASASRGGALYDKWWAVAGATAPTEDHPLWANRPDQDSNTRTGSDTWRCKECHGWDYKGVNGAYGSGSHRTGINGIFGTMLSAQDVFDAIKNTHSFGTMTALSDDDIWDLAKFVLEGQIDTNSIITGTAFNGSAAAGMSTYDATCASCHGADGLSLPPGADADHDDWVGKIAKENPWEFQHKVRFGQPGTSMPAQFGLLSLDQVADLSAHSQTLPTAPMSAGEVFYVDKGCAACHGADATGGNAPGLIGATSNAILEKLDGTVAHVGGTVDGVTAQDAADLEAWLGSM